MGLKRTLIALLALSVAFQGAQPWSVATREVSAESKAAAPKRKAPPRRVFSTRASVDPLTPEAVAFSGALAKSIPSRLTRESLRKFTFKRAKSNSFVSAETKFSLSALASDRRSWARGVATVTAGDMFVAFIPSGNGLVGIVEAVQRRVGNKKVDLKREAQLRAAGFKVHLLVDRFQVVLWDSLDPKGIELTVAKAPTLITRPLSPQEFASVLIPPKGSASSMKVARMVTPAMLAVMTATTAAIEEREPALKRWLRPEREVICFFGPSANVPDNEKACPKPYDDIKCDYSGTKRELTLNSEKVFAKSQEDCRKAAEELNERKCREQKIDPVMVTCPVAIPTANTGPDNSNDYICATPELQQVGVRGGECISLFGLDCKDRKPDRVLAALDYENKKVTCKCFWAAKDDPTCPGDPDTACHYDEKSLEKKIPMIPGESNKIRVENCHASCETQEAKTARIECAGVEA